MRKRIWITCVVVLAACLALLLLKTTQRQVNVVPEPSETLTNQQSPGQPIQSHPSAPEPTANVSRLPPAAIAEMARHNSPEASNALQERALAVWRVPIDFYGKAADENSNAVAGASVSFAWSETPTAEGELTAKTQSDAEGLFSLHGKHGPSLEVWISKEGYYSAHGGQRGFSYRWLEGFKPDPHNPVIFSLRKKGQGAELVTSENGIRPNVAVRVPKNGTPVRVDLFQKQVSATGQLEISQNKPPWKEATEWSFALSIPAGGFVENQDEFQFEAPDTNYQPAVEYRFTKGGTNWTTHVTEHFYHSAEFRGDYWQQQGYWSELLGAEAFNLK